MAADWDPTGAGLREQLQAALGSAITLEHELSGGGMSRVFAATETALGRRVVVKILLPEMAEGVSADRFGREIRFAASLQQANIVPVLATGEMDGLPFYTMPFVEGLSLRERLRKERSVSLSDAVSILRDVARALAYAHEHGVVHRDIKPENVLLSGDAAVVTDFGIAKAISVARTSSVTGDATGLTRAGVAIGTPAYMAPEQASGEHTTDHRADIYSFGCLAYELITGAPPFSGRGARELFAAHLTQIPVPLSQARSDCPPAIASAVMQCLEKDPARRPQSTREILKAFDTLNVPRGGTRRLLRIAAEPRTLIVAGAVVIVALLGLLLFRQRETPAGAAPKSIAVLPLTNVGGDSAQEYLADGMTDELSTAIGKLGGLRVASRSLARRYHGQRDVDVREAGRVLNVAYVLQGSLRRIENKLRVAATLTSAADGVELWSDIYDRGPNDVFALQDDITRGIASALHLTRADTLAQSSARGTSDPVAYDLYLRGRYLLERRGAGVRQSVDHFQRAIARDSDFARAYAGLSLALEFLPYFGGVPAAEVRASVTTAAKRALALDSTLAEAHVALGLAAEHAYDWETAGREFRSAIALAPREQPAHLQYGRYLLYVNRVPDALAEFEIAKSLDPYSALPSAWLGEALSIQGRQEEGLSEFRRALEIDSLNGPALQFMGPFLARGGRTDEARIITERLPKSQIVYEGIVGYMLAAKGDRASALQVEHQLRSSKSRAWFTNTSLAYIYLGLRDTSRAVASLERATDRGEIWPTYVPIRDPMYDEVRQSAHFAALLRRVGLQDVGFTTPSTHGSR